LSTVPQISRDEVARLAKLARLALTDQELMSFAGQLDAILGHVSQIQAVDTGDVKPTGNPLARRAGAQRPGDVGSVNVTRPDVVEQCLTQEEALAEAPAAAEGRFAVPQILGEEQ
jgi:aspartyl-tRNA(Asn)/glutamyl-tRNA(Gln) amidotransferase subunit C